MRLRARTGSSNSEDQYIQFPSVRAPLTTQFVFPPLTQPVVLLLVEWMGRADKAGPPTVFCFSKEGGEEHRRLGAVARSQEGRKCVFVYLVSGSEDGVKLLISGCGGERMTASDRSFWVGVSSHCGC